MNAESLTRALSGRWSGSSGVARCPSHDDHDPSLSVSEGEDGKLLVKCHGGCSQESVIAALRARGLWPSASWPTSTSTTRRTTMAKPTTAPNGAPSPNQNHALEIWRASRPAENTPVEQYLHSRGITTPIPATVRFHPALKHPDTGLHLPALVAAVANAARKVTGIQRIFLT
ncbi:MAG: virulence-associated protein E, partial [Alphaproteobacteria bacterium]|nr:virulence-associated protein E [Alphaproteobacteria bacterium]